MSEEKKNFLHYMEKSHAFIFGIIAGILVICTIGFFILLTVVFSGDSCIACNGKTASAVAEDGGPEKFSQCLDSGETANTVKADLQLGASIGVNGTPATFINGYLISGALPYQFVKPVIDDLLAGKDPAVNWDSEQFGELVKVDMPDLPDAEWKGGKNAKITMVEFADFECPYCVHFVPTVQQALDEYGDQVRYTFRHFPLSFHANAQKAAEAFECAKEQGKWFEMYEKLYELSGNSQLGVANYKKAASELGLK